jgi:hypothetical protein
MANIIFGLCAMSAILCSWLLLQAYAVKKYRLLLWGGLCFTALTLNNILLIMDRVIFLQVDLSTWRLLTALGGMIILLYGLIWDTESKR